MACPVCASSEAQTLVTAVGPRAYCRVCFHGWRTDRPAYPYTNTAMCGLGTSAARLKMQIAFFAPYVTDGARVLEIGCATGELAAAVRASLSIGAYDGIELSPAGESARQVVDRLYVKPLPELLADGVIDDTFDAILMSHVLEHLADPGAELKAMKRVLAPDGIIFLEVPNRGGARSLDIDDNRSHLHFFCATSLMRLLANHGIETVAAATGAKLDDRYADSLQVVATPFQTPKWSRTQLSDHPALAGEERIVVWGAGSLADEVLANYFDPASIDFFIDANPAKVGSTTLGRPVRGPEALGVARRTVLVNSIDFADAITTDIHRLYPGSNHRLVRVGDLIATAGPEAKA